MPPIAAVFWARFRLLIDRKPCDTCIASLASFGSLAAFLKSSPMLCSSLTVISKKGSDTGVLYGLRAVGAGPEVGLQDLCGAQSGQRARQRSGLRDAGVMGLRSQGSADAGGI